MAFKKVGSLNPHGAPVLRKETLSDSITVTEGDSVKVGTDGMIALGTAGALVFGHVEGVVTKDGVGVDDNGAGSDYVGTYTTGASNESSVLIAANVDVSKLSLYSVDPDATIGTTTGSNLLGYHTDIADEDETDEDTAATTSAQYFIHGVDPQDSGNQIVNIYESQIFGI